MEKAPALGQRNHRGIIYVSIALAAAGILTACGSSTSDAPSPTASGSSSASSSSSASPATDIVGSWQADAGEILTANTANVGGPGGMSCSGRIVMTFTDEGRFTRRGSVQCTVGGTSRSGAVVNGGTYSTSGDTLTIGGARSTGDIPDAWGSGRATYSIAGSTLTITFSGGSAGTITQQYQRV